MTEDQKKIHATIAAAIIMSRGAKTVEEVQKALLDAEYILHPRPDDKAYKDWQIANGFMPSTPEEDEAKVAQKATNMKRMSDKLTGRDWMTR